MKMTISNLLNRVFPVKVPSWNGNALFGPFDWDTEQQVSTAKRRRLRSRTLTEDATTTSTTECPQRDIECEGDVCLWGCLPVETSNCGVSSLVNWVALETEIQDSLLQLNYTCLGNTSQLQVNMVVDDQQDMQSGS